MYTLIIKNEKEYNALIRALETEQDIADDTSTETLWRDQRDRTPITHEDLAAIKTDIDERIDRLVAVTFLLERARCLKP